GKKPGMKVYARCVWHEGNDQLEEEETLLGTWVDEKNHTIRWPTRVNVLRALREMRDPEPHWKTFTLIKVKLWSKVKTPLSGKSASRIPTDNERNVTHSPAGSSSWLLSKPNKSKFPLQEANYQYRTISLLVEILETLKKMSTGMDVEGDEDVQVCGSFEELDEFESILSQNTHRKKILKNLSKIGGQQFEENTRNVMRK
uniref:Uncharacterized protein n=1 Tax=Clytia hemisphaerica TaxID=252671 RepID=A0A7M5V9G8_9CNID